MVADNRGTLRIFCLGQETATMTANYRLTRSPDLKGDFETSISSLHITQNEHVVIVTFENGLVSAYDIRNGFSWIGDIERDAHRLTIASSSISPSLCKILEKDD